MGTRRSKRCSGSKDASPRRARGTSALEAVGLVVAVGAAGTAGFASFGRGLGADIADRSDGRVRASQPMVVAGQAGMVADAVTVMKQSVAEARESVRFADAVKSKAQHMADRLRGPERLSFSVKDGPFDNAFYREADIAAHVVTKSGDAPRVVTAFPAGNSGGGLWFRAPDGGATLRIEGAPKPWRPARDMRGVGTVIHASADSLSLEQAVLGNVRVLREYIYTDKLVDGVTHRARIGRTARFSRSSVDGSLRYELTVEPLRGTRLEAVGEGRFVLRAKEPGAGLTFRVRTASNERPLTPIPAGELFSDGAAVEPALRNTLSFLAYDEKLLAGSWRFLTYFGRDTLMSVRLLMPALKPRAVEAGLSAVLERLDAVGQVAHEEDLGDFAALRRAKERLGGAATDAILDYKMVDDDLMLSPVLAEYLLRTKDGTARADTFLSRRSADGTPYRALVLRNMDFVEKRAERFAATGRPEDLVGLKEGEATGQWRDSNEGLGGGKYAYDVNAVLMPAALRSSAELAETIFGDPTRAARLRSLATAWDRAKALFDVEIPETEAKQRVAAYAKELGIQADPSLDAIHGPVRFHAIALTADGRPIPVMHSDEGFALLFGAPSEGDLAHILATTTAPFPAGLHTGAGMLVANGAFVASPSLRATFSPAHYHGAVVWSWQQALFLEGLARQLRRTDLSAATRTALTRAQRVLWDTVDGNRDMRASELWTWKADARTGQITPAPYGMEAAHHTESNAAQLWSTVYLAVTRPK